MLERIQSWYCEAVACHGDDWPKIEQYVAQKLESVCDADRARLIAEFNAFRPRRCDTFN